jgi:hypothetical protein
MTPKRRPCQDVDEFVWWEVQVAVNRAGLDPIQPTIESTMFDPTQWEMLSIVQEPCSSLTSVFTPPHPALRKFLKGWRVRTMMARHLGELTLARELEAQKKCPWRQIALEVPGPVQSNVCNEVSQTARNTVGDALNPVGGVIHTLDSELRTLCGHFDPVPRHPRLRKFLKSVGK